MKMWRSEGRESRVAVLSWSWAAEGSEICRSTLPYYAMVPYTEELCHVGPLCAVEGVTTIILPFYRGKTEVQSG